MLNVTDIHIFQQAFEKLGQETLDAIGKDPEKLQELLRRHVIEGNFQLLILKLACLTKLFSAMFKTFIGIRFILGKHSFIN